MNVSARKTAYLILSEVCSGSYLNLSAKKYLSALKDSGDRKFCSALVFCTLENLVYIDYIIDRFVEKNPKKPVRNILRLGAAQILFMNSVPDRAASDESVKLCSEIGKSQLKGFVNAVMRKIAAQGGSVPIPEDDPAVYMSIKYSYPEWICRRYIKELGYEKAQSLLSCRKSGALTSFRLVRGNMPDCAQPSHYLKNVFSMENVTDMESDPGFLNGDITPMGESSVICVDSAGIKAGDSVLDVCAAPGGKTAYAAEKCAHIVSCDIHEHRLDLIRRNLSRLNTSNAEVMLCDACGYNADFDSAFDVVLCDVPCSALGLMYRKPDIRFSKTEKDIEEISKVQKRILENCASYVKPGGKLVYSTCTVSRDENENTVSAFVGKSGFSLCDFSAEVPEAFGKRAETGMLQIMPDSDGIDGFFVSVMRRNA